MKPALEYVACNLCGSRVCRPFRTKFELDLVRCRNCGLVYANPRLSEKEIFKRYSPEYFYQEYLPIFRATDAGFDSALVRDHFFLYLALLEQLCPGGGRLLDVGCGPGLFIHAARDKGWEGEGVEISPAAAEYAEKTVGVRVHRRKLEDIAYGDGTFDAVTMLDTIEHLTDPLRTLGEIRRILKPGGALILNTPDLGSLNRFFLGRDWAVLSPAEHLYNFNHRTLSEILLKAGFDPILVRDLPLLNPAYTHNPGRFRARVWKAVYSRISRKPAAARLLAREQRGLLAAAAALSRPPGRTKPGYRARLYAGIRRRLRGDTLTAVALNRGERPVP